MQARCLYMLSNTTIQIFIDQNYPECTSLKTFSCGLRAGNAGGPAPAETGCSISDTSSPRCTREVTAKSTVPSNPLGPNLDPVTHSHSRSLTHSLTHSHSHARTHLPMRSLTHSLGLASLNICSWPYVAPATQKMLQRIKLLNWIYNKCVGNPT